jgi:hypothetical protein
VALPLSGRELNCTLKAVFRRKEMTETIPFVTLVTYAELLALYRDYIDECVKDAQQGRIGVFRCKQHPPLSFDDWQALEDEDRFDLMEWECSHEERAG